MTAAQPPRPRNQRQFSSHLVNRDLRLRLVLDDMIFALVAALAAVGILYWLSNREIGDSLYSAHLSIKQTRELLTNGAKIAGLVTFLAVLLFGLWSLVDAHRIAGPVHRLRRLLAEVAGGNLTHEIQFRRRDEFQDIAQAADSLVDTYADRLAQIQRQFDALAAALDAEPVDAAALQAIRGRAVELKSQLAYFRVPSDGATPVVDGNPLA